MVLYGLSTCDTCRKAVKTLASRNPTVVDVRADGVAPELLNAWVAEFGADAIVNRRSTTWRGLSEAERASADTPNGAAALLAARPTLMKRPVIVVDGTAHLGWTPAVRAALGVDV